MSKVCNISECLWEDVRQTLLLHFGKYIPLVSFSFNIFIVGFRLDRGKRGDISQSIGKMSVSLSMGDVYTESSEGIVMYIINIHSKFGIF